MSSQKPVFAARHNTPESHKNLKHDRDLPASPCSRFVTRCHVISDRHVNVTSTRGTVATPPQCQSQLRIGWPPSAVLLFSRVRGRAPGLARSESGHPCGREHRALRLLEQRLGVDPVLSVDFVEYRPHDLRQAERTGPREARKPATNVRPIFNFMAILLNFASGSRRAP